MTIPAIFFADSFDHYLNTAQISEGYWTTITGISLQPGRLVGTCLQLENPFAITPGSITKFFSQDIGSTGSTVGFAWYSQYSAETLAGVVLNVFQFSNNYNPLQLQINSDYTLGAFSGTTPIAWSEFSVNANTWYYIEIAFKVTGIYTGSPTFPTVTVIVRVNGVTVMSGTGTGSSAIPSTWTSVDSLSVVGINNIFGFTLIDDFYIAASGTPTDPTSFLGDVGIQVYTLTGDVAGNQWTGSYSDINPNPPTDAADISTTTHGDTSFFTVQNITGSGPYIAALKIQGVQTDFRGFGVSMDQLQALIGSPSSYTPGTNINVPTILTGFYSDFSVEPNSSSPWTAANFNADEFGVKYV